MNRVSSKRLPPTTFKSLGFCSPRAQLTTHRQNGRYEWGSPARPQTLEAIALHQIENLSAQVSRFRSLLAARREPGEAWTDFDRMLGRQLYAGHAGDLNIEESSQLE